MITLMLTPRAEREIFITTLYYLHFGPWQDLDSIVVDNVFQLGLPTMGSIICLIYDGPKVLTR